MNHYIKEIYIKKLRHLSDIKIELNNEHMQHLLLTGKNGSGKTSLLIALAEKLNNICNDIDEKEISDIQNGIEVSFNNKNTLNEVFQNGSFITAFFMADRKTEIEQPTGVQDIKLSKIYDIDDNPGQILLKYMVHLKTQQAYAKNESDSKTVKRIADWFEHFENALKVLLDDASISLEYDYKNYDFRIHQKGRNAFNFNELSDGYSSVIYIVSDLMLRMDRNWLLKDTLCVYDEEGIVLIDELETHLHIELQKKILPFLTSFFPNIQFIITTHSPYILNSIDNAMAFDMEHYVELDNLTGFSTDDLAEVYFDVDSYSEKLKRRMDKYHQLLMQKVLNDEEKAERAKLRYELKKSLKKFEGTELAELYDEMDKKESL
ncbi:AAA family ATPase [Agathobacter rectalis]|uniref:AAA family ATPase n=1 Tax=Agathobacter rectalis TaxID=39491 RepID=UPI0027D25BB2|nr:AAA family ATPase [Agathobacter rectalis]